MTKTDLVAQVAEKVSNLKKKDCEKAVNAVFQSIQEALARGEKAQFIGFGTFEVKQRKARKGRNPQTGKEIKIPASKVPVFKAGKALKDAVAKKK
ncbi:HU family DNA-binding protein [Thermincola potens]|uniref:Histone family protein DNA-binding protein n=1 Tax=Thermincola potens (strain JR) TaxID=635013 RepID=D5XFC8_THEPJ|nr:HU family DNA-binding protein [Thermincola potens]ADG82349.1 histone family protein DNA-binding protein [Thermincola potens JR]